MAKKHPWHKECIKPWLALNRQCPECKVSLDHKAIFTWKERAVIALNHIKCDAYQGAISGTIIGVQQGLIHGVASLGIGKYSVMTVAVLLSLAAAHILPVRQTKMIDVVPANNHSFSSKLGYRFL